MEYQPSCVFLWKLLISEFDYQQVLSIGKLSTSTVYLNLPEHEEALPVRILQTLPCHLAVKPVIKIGK